MDKYRIIGILFVVVIPFGLCISACLFYFLGIYQSFLVSIVLSAVYVGYAIESYSYDSRSMNRIKIPATQDIERLMKTFSSDGYLINKILISAFQNGRELSQTELYKYATEEGVHLSQMRIRTYAVELEKYGIISSPKTTYKKRYTLTKKGKWCADAYKTLFPRCTFVFMATHYLNLRRVAPFTED